MVTATIEAATEGISQRTLRSTSHLLFAVEDISFNIVIEAGQSLELITPSPEDASTRHRWASPATMIRCPLEGNVHILGPPGQSVMATIMDGATDGDFTRTLRSTPLLLVAVEGASI